MENEVVKAARARVTNTMGEKLARKASNAFCLAYGAPAPSSFAETLGPKPPASVIVEFNPQPDVSDAIDNAVESLRGSKSWTRFRNELKKIKLPPVTSGRVTEVMESGRSEPELLPLGAARVLRHLKVMSSRDNFYKVTGPITDSIERHSQAFVHSETTRARSPRAPITEVCWLNRTVRLWGDPRALAEAASDDSIEVVDLPRPLTREINISARTVGAPQFSTRFKKSGKGIIVAIIDGEVALTHPALIGRVVHKMNFTDEPWGNPDSHGTAIAGIIASNDTSFAGMATEVTIYNYKVMATNSISAADFDGSLAIQHALEDGVQAANCSWGNGPAGDGTSREARACDNAWKKGMVIIKSAGNHGPGISSMTTPADADGVIVVGATEREGASVQDYSSRGPAGTKSRPHLVAPGGIHGGPGITSCLVGGGFGDTGAGTSLATPHVTGLVALLLERDPSLTPDEVRNSLLSVCTSLNGFDLNTEGAGLLSLLQLT